MASSRATFFNDFVTQLATITGITTSGHGKEPAQLDEYTESQLPLLWVIHGKTNKTEKIPNKYRITEATVVQIFYADWEIIENKSTAESWIELIVEKAESDYTINESVNFIDVKNVNIRDRDFPISCVEVEFEVVYHINRTDF